MARAGVYRYLEWETNSRNPYAIDYTMDQDGVEIIISFAESGYEFT